MSKFKKNMTVQTLNIGVFTIRLSESKAEIETRSGEFKYIIAGGTRPYAELVNMIARDYKEKIHVLCNALYSSTMFFYYPEFCAEWLIYSQKQVDKMKSEISKNN